MREIKFRGKRVDNGEWIYGDLVHLPDNRFAIVECGLFTVKLSVEVLPESVGQYTGLRDKFYEEIYEGDIVKQKPINCDSEKIGVTSIRSTQGVCFGAYAYFVTPCEIIGNIHENPELLKEA